MHAFKGKYFLHGNNSYVPYTKKVALYFQLAEDALTPATQFCSNKMFENVNSSASS
jgi:hypothetical protein